MPILLVDRNTYQVQTLTPERGAAAVTKVSAASAPHSPLEQSQAQTKAHTQAAHGRDETPNYKLERGLLAEDVMSTPVVSLTLDDDIHAAHQRLNQHHFRHLPVISATSELCGIVSDRDLLGDLSLRKGQPMDAYFSTPIREVMRGPVLTVTPDTDAREVARLMAGKRIGALPVVSEKGDEHGPRVLGMITKSDLYTLIINAVIFDQRI